MKGARELHDRWLVARRNIRHEFVDIEASELKVIVLSGCVDSDGNKPEASQNL